MLTFAVPCIFGLEALVKDELRALGLTGIEAEDGRVLCRGEISDIPRLNISLRCGERVLLLLSSFPAPDFDALFDGAAAVPWEDYIPRDGAFPVKGFALDSALRSTPDCQRIIKKAAADRLGRKYGLVRLPETGADYRIQFGILRDRCSLYLDTSGPALYKRGYRAAGTEAPLRETLAAALVRFTRFNGRDPFRDPFCGSGTLAIEAALIARNRAPGLDRRFAAQRWRAVESRLWVDAAGEAMDKEYDRPYDIRGGDVDPGAVAIARENAVRAGVEDTVRFEVADARDFSVSGEYGQIATNPPYGQRLMDLAEARELCAAFGRACRSLPERWRAVILSSDPDFEKCFGRRADRRRNLFNGGLRCTAYTYGGTKGGGRP